MSKLAERGWAMYWNELNQVWSHESGWDPHAYGPMTKKGRACGIPMRLPCSGLDAWSFDKQIDWGLDYIAARYGSPAGAWGHFRSHRWY